MEISQNYYDPSGIYPIVPVPNYNPPIITPYYPYPYNPYPYYYPVPMIVPYYPQYPTINPIWITCQGTTQ